MRKVILFQTIITLTAFSAFAQNKKGLFGKTQFVEFNSLSCFNAFSHLGYYNGGYYSYSPSENSLSRSTDKFNYGWNVTVGTALKKGNAGFSLQTGFWYSNANGPSDLRVYDPQNGWFTAYIAHENLRVRTFILMPVVHLTENGSFFPAGLNHEIGFGLLSSRIADREYALKSMDEGSYYWNGTYTPVNKIVDSIYQSKGSPIDTKSAIKGYSILYGIKFRTPVSKNVVISWGLRYTLNFTFKSQDYGWSDQGNYGISNIEVYESVKRVVSNNRLSLNVGAAWIL